MTIRGTKQIKSEIAQLEDELREYKGQELTANTSVIIQGLKKELRKLADELEDARVKESKQLAFG